MRPGSTSTLTNVVLWTGNRYLISGTEACMGAGPFTGTPTISAVAGNRGFHVVAGNSLVMSDVNLVGGDPAAGEDGGTIFVGGTSSLAMFGGTLSGGVADTADGGCLFGAQGSTVVLDGVTVENCTADDNGGGIALDYGSLGLFYSVTVRDNVAGFQGGGIFADGSDVDLLFDSVITGNFAGYGGGGIGITGNFAAADLDVKDDTHIDLNDAGWRGGGIFAIATLADVDVDITERVVLDGNETEVWGGGIYVDGTENLLTLSLADEVVLSDNTAPLGGGISAAASFVNLFDDVLLQDNTAVDQGGGMHLRDCTVGIYGSTMTAPGAAGATTRGVRFERNSTPWNLATLARGSAIFAEQSTTIDVDQMAVEGHDGAVVSLSDGSTMTANRSHFNDNPAVVLFEVPSGTMLEVEAEFGEAGCDDALDPLVFAADRYCSEISYNEGMLMSLGGTALIRTTAIMSNQIKATNTGFDVDGDLAFTTNMVGNNVFDNSPSVLVAVHGGADFEARQNTFADNDLPVDYEAGSTGDFRRNAAFDSGAGVAVVVDGGAVVTGTQNIGDWSGAVSSAFANGTAPGWVTTARGQFHLSATSTAVNICSTDGPFDVEGTARPVPAGAWDAGSIEFTP